MMRRIIMLAGISMLAACGQGEGGDAGADSAADDEYVPLDLAGLTGPVLITLADGSQVLNVSSDDGTDYSASLADQGSWANEGEEVCVTPGEGDGICFSFGVAAADGTAPLITSDGEEGTTIKNLGEAFVAGETPATQAGAYLITYADGTSALTTMSSVGTTYYAADPVSGTWSTSDGMRCGKLDSQEADVCDTPGDEAADGSFTATPQDGSDAFRVMPIF